MEEKTFITTEQTEKRICPIHGETSAFFFILKTETNEILGGPYCGHCCAKFLDKTICKMQDKEKSPYDKGG